MAEREQEVFLPKEVDEQIDEYLIPSTANQQLLDIPAQETVQALQRHFAPSQQDAGLERVWQRFEQQRARMHSRGRADFRAPGQQERRYRMKQVVGSSQKESGNGWARRLNLIAAVMFVALLVGSMVALFRLAPHGQTGATKQPQEKMMFVLTNQTLYRLDMNTHQVLWHVNVPGGMGFGQVVNDTYYITLTNNSLTKLCALDVATGKVRWQVDQSGRSLTQPVISNNTVYFSTRKGGYQTVVALDRASGVQKWEHRLGDSTGNTNAFMSGSAVALIAASDQALYGEMMTMKDGKKSGLRFALNAQDGEQLWQRDEEIAYLSGIEKGFVVDGVLAVAKESDDMNVQQGLTGQGYVVGYDAVSGRQIWSKPLDGSLSIYGTTVVNGVIYVNTHHTGQGNSIYAFSVKDGAQLWRYQDPNTSGSSYPTVTENGVYINRYAGQTLVALDSTTGKIRWMYNFHDNLTVEYPPSADNDQVYLSLPDNVIQIFRASDGKKIGSFKVNGKVDPNNRVLLQVIE